MLPYKGKAKFTLEQVTKGQRGVEVSSTLSSTSAINGVGGQRHGPAALAPQIDPIPIV